jgi:hypothetical protein
LGEDVMNPESEAIPEVGALKSCVERSSKAMLRWCEERGESSLNFMEIKENVCGDLTTCHFLSANRDWCLWKTQISNLTVVKGSLGKNIPKHFGYPKCCFALLRLRITSLRT